MKINYISLRKKLKEIRENKKKEEEETIEEKIDETIDEAKTSNSYNKEEISLKDNKPRRINLNNVKGNIKKAPKGSYTLILLMITLLVITTKLNLDTYSKLRKEDYETYTNLQNEDITAVSNDNVVIYQEAVSSICDINNENQIAIKASSENVENRDKDILEDEKYVYEYSYLRPVDGNTLKEYSMDKVIYSKTLDMWKVHDGIDICANVGEDVKASENGIVERIYNDAFYGYSIIITVYRNLDEDIKIKEGQSVKKGETIAKVSNTASGESKDETHIHFEVIQNGEIVNPDVIGIK